MQFLGTLNWECVDEYLTTNAVTEILKISNNNMSTDIIDTSVSVKYFLEQNIISSWTTRLADQHDVVEFLNYFWMMMHQTTQNSILWNKEESNIILRMIDFMSDLSNTSYYNLECKVRSCQVKKKNAQ